MPNHIYSTLEFLGEKKKLVEIQDFLQNKEEKDHHFDFNKVIPTPDDIFQGNLGEAERKLYGDRNWYDWNQKNWGTKWNSYSNRVDLVEIRANTLNFITDKENLSVLCYYFETAWSPICNTILPVLSEKFPDTPFKYSAVDEGSNFGLTSLFLGGEAVKEKDYKNMKSLFNYTSLPAKERAEKALRELRRYLK